MASEEGATYAGEGATYEGEGATYEHSQLLQKYNDNFTRTVLPVTVFVGVEVVVGFFGNLLVLYVFLFRYHTCNFRYFVLCLAFTDIIGTLTTMPGEILTQLKWYIYPVEEICKVKSFFNVFTVSAEAFCLLTIAIDRYRKVCTPFGWQIQPRIAIVLCGVIYLLSIILSLPVAILWGTRSLEKVYQNRTITVTLCEKDEDFAHTDRPSDYTTGINVVLSTLLALMMILYVFVARKLAMQKRAVKSGRKIKSVPSSTGCSSGPTSGLSSEVGKIRFKAELSDTGYSSTGNSSDADFRKKPAKNNVVSSDGGLTTDEEEPPISTIIEFQSHGPPGSTLKTKVNKIHKRKQTKSAGNRLRRKTRIMFILTLTFVITTVTYLALLSLIAKSDDVLQEMSDTGRAFYFFFFRIYFINHVINPLVYGLLDPHFRKVMKNLKHSICKCTK